MRQIVYLIILLALLSPIFLASGMIVASQIYELVFTPEQEPDATQGFRSASFEAGNMFFVLKMNGNVLAAFLIVVGAISLVIGSTMMLDFGK